jgi:hypothetical protein
MGNFALDSIVRMREYSAKDDPDTVVGRAESKLGSKDYNLVTNNCEHFATWCCTGKTASQQVRRVSSLTTSGAATATSLGTTAAVVSAAGSVAGVSGAGVMSGLATAGSLVGGGAAAGPIVLALAPAAVAIGAVHVGLRSDKTLPKKENLARRDGRYAWIAGAAAAGAGGTAAIATAGVTGLSAAGIASGLAAVGGVVGGGMVAGTVVLAAAPAVLAGAAGWGAYMVSRRARGIRSKKWAPPPPDVDDWRRRSDNRRRQPKLRVRLGQRQQLLGVRLGQHQQLLGVGRRDPGSPRSHDDPGPAAPLHDQRAGRAAAPDAGNRPEADDTN